MAQNPQDQKPQGAQGAGQGQTGQGQTYTVKVDFTDQQGRQWTAGSQFTGDQEAVKKALAAGQIAQAEKPTPQQT